MVKWQSARTRKIDNLEGFPLEFWTKGFPRATWRNFQAEAAVAAAAASSSNCFTLVM